MVNKTKKQIYTITVRAGKRTYFLDVYKTVQDRFYIKIDQSVWKGEKRYLRNNILIFEDDIGKFYDAFTEIKDFINGGRSG